MLYCLLDGCARTSTELAIVAGVSPSTASLHLQRLRTDKLVKLHSQGRHRYYSLTGPDVAGILEALSVLAYGRTHERRPTSPNRLRAARTCYDHMAKTSDFVPVPCSFPTCNSVTYAYIDENKTVIPLPRILNVDDYLDYISNRVMPDLGADLKRSPEGLWSSSAALGSEKVASEFAFSCSACGLPDGGLDVAGLSKFMFMIMLQDFMDPWTFNQKNLMKCCKEFLLPGGKQIPFCAYNTVGYREQARAQLTAQEPARRKAQRDGPPYVPQPITFRFDGVPELVNL